MKKIVMTHKPKVERYIFTEGINYFRTNRKSIWGLGDKDTLKILKKTRIKGKWLNIAGGDGRYNLELLKKAEFVIASDIDKSALSKLWNNTPTKYRKKLSIKIFDVTKNFPFKKNSFDGIFCTGILHLFPKNVFKNIFNEIDRILKPTGKIIIDFATNIKRIDKNGKEITFGNEPKYNLNEAKMFLKNVFKKYKFKMYNGVVSESVKRGNPPYKFSSKFLVLIANKG